MTRARSWLLTALLAATLGTITACSTGIRVDRSSRSEALFTAFKENLVGVGTPAVRTEQTLRKYDLDRLAASAPAETEGRLLQLLKTEPPADLLYALAELTFLRGRKAEAWSAKDSLPLYYRSAGYAYHYLFTIARPAASEGGPDKRFTPQDVFDPRFRLACELYNQSLAKCLSAALAIGKLEPSRVLSVPTPDGGTFELSVVQNGFVWPAEDFTDVQLCADYRVRGLANHHRTYGLGVPLIVTRKVEQDHNETYLADHSSFPATAFFRFEGSIDDLVGGRCGRLELYDPLRVHAIDVRGLHVPLESDVTTPLAYSLARSELQGVWLKGFFRPQTIEDQTGLYMIEPYQPGKIPVVFIHGLLSSPLAWAPMFNDLRAEPDLRDKFQFWFYFYPTSAPFFASAASLRNRLAELRRRVDPQGKDPSLDRMVLVGHSMGGLIARLQTVDSENAFYELTGEPALDSLALSEEARRTIRDSLFFEHNRAVARAVFIGTPHRGSGLSLSTPGRIVGSLAGMPRVLMRTSMEVLDSAAGRESRFSRSRLPTSVDLLRPNAPALEVLMNRPRPPETTYHSIVGVTRNSDLVLERALGGQVNVLGDGIVPYESAHLADVESELIVPANHFDLPLHPLSVLEVRRILREHLK